MLSLRLACWDSARNRRSMLTITAILAAALSTYVILGAVIVEMSGMAGLAHRSESPWDITIIGADAHSVANEAREVAGVENVTEAYIVSAIVGSGYYQFMSLTGVQEPSIEVLEEGRFAQDSNEVALPRGLASKLEAPLGSRVAVLPLDALEPVMLEVVGIISGRLGSLPLPVVTSEGLERIGGDLVRNQALLIVLDGQVSIGATESRMRTLAQGLAVSSQREQYSAVQKGAGLAGVLAGSLRFLVLTVSAASVGALTYLRQREKAHQYGVLRAVGATRATLALASGFQTVLAAIAGTALSYLIAMAVRRPLGLRSASVLAGFIRDSLVLGTAAVVVVLVLSRSLLRRTVCSLLTDPWGRE